MILHDMKACILQTMPQVHNPVADLEGGGAQQAPPWIWLSICFVWVFIPFCSIRMLKNKAKIAWPGSI